MHSHIAGVRVIQVLAVCLVLAFIVVPLTTYGNIDVENLSFVLLIVSMYLISGIKIFSSDVNVKTKVFEMRLSSSLVVIAFWVLVAVGAKNVIALVLQRHHLTWVDYLVVASGLIGGIALGYSNRGDDSGLATR